MTKNEWYTQGFDAALEITNKRQAYICEQIRQTVEQSCDELTANVINNWLFKLEGKQCKQSRLQR